MMLKLIQGWRFWFLTTTLLLFSVFNISYYTLNNQQVSPITNKIKQVNIISRRKSLIHLKAFHQNIDQQQYEPTNLVDKSIPQLAKKRVDIGQPINNEQRVKVMSFQNNNNKRESFCTIVNGLNSVNGNSIDLVKNLLKYGSMYKIAVIIGPKDYRSEQLIRKHFQRNQLQTKQSIIDSDYNFIRNSIVDCKKLVYLLSNFQMQYSMIEKLKYNMIMLEPLSVIYTQVSIIDSCERKLNNFNEIDLHNIPASSFNQHIYIFDAQFLKFITPHNFAFYAKYTLEEIFIVPILMITQNTQNLVGVNEILHKFNSFYSPNHKYAINSPHKQQNSFCFISYPSNPFMINKEQYQNYLKSLLQNNSLNNSVSIIVYLPYKLGFSQLILSSILNTKILIRNSKLNITRFRVRVIDKAVSSYSVYDAVYSYCPNSTLVVSSRHNILFKIQFIQVVTSFISQKYHYYHTKYLNSNNQEVYLTAIPKYEKYFIRRTNFFQTYLKDFQIFKSDLLKTSLFYVLKCHQVDFYQTQSPFVIHMLEVVQLKLFYINVTLVTVNKRNQSQLQIKQIENVKKYVEYFPLENTQLLMPYLYNALQNKAYERFAPYINNRIIHQIWLSNSPISVIRLRLQRTIVQINRNFEIRLWKFQNVTAQNFPLTYKLAQRILQYHKTSFSSYFTLAADLLRYQILYRHGGLYIDFKMEALKPLDQFLKYEILFLDADILSLRYQSPKAIGIGILGGIPNNYYYKIILTELIYEQNIDFKKMIPLMSGAYVARRAFNDKQFFNVLGLGYQLINPLPYQPLVSACGGVNKTFEIDQQVYIISDYKTKQNIKLGIPCRQYPQSYVVNHPPLSGTWLFQKRQVG